MLPSRCFLWLSDIVSQIVLRLCLSTKSPGSVSGTKVKKVGTLNLGETCMESSKDFAAGCSREMSTMPCTPLSATSSAPPDPFDTANLWVSPKQGPIVSIESLLGSSLTRKRYINMLTRSEMRIFLSSRRLFQDSHVALFSWYCEYTQTDAYRQTHTDRHAHRQDRHTHTQIDTNRHKQIDAHIDRHTYTEYAIILYKSHIVDESYYTIASIHTRTCNICIHT